MTSKPYRQHKARVKAPETFFQVPDSIQDMVRGRLLSVTEAWIFMLAYRERFRGNGILKASYRNLALDSGCSTATAVAATNRLQALRLLTKLPRPDPLSMSWWKATLPSEIGLE